MHLRSSLSSQAWWLMLISGIFALSVGLSNTYVNVYLWKVDRSYGAIGWYNLFVYATIPAAFVVAGWMAKRLHTIWTLRIGVALHASFYAIALFGGTRIAEVPVVLGIVMGIAGGFYWFSFNMLSLRVTKDGTRDRFYGFNGVVGAVAGMVAPPVAGYLITQEDKFGGLSGYHVTFALSLGLFVLAAVLTLLLKANRNNGRLKLRLATEALKDRSWRGILIGCLLYGPREGVFLFLIGLLLYISTGSEFRLGEFVLLQSGLSFVSFFLVGKFVKSTNRLWVLAIGAVCMAGAAMLFLLPLTARLIIWYGSLIAVVLPLFLVPLQGFVFDAISALSTDGKHTAELVIAREVFGNVGRVIGISAFLALVSLGITGRGIAYFAVVLGFAQLGTLFFIWRGVQNRGQGRLEKEELTYLSPKRRAQS